MEQSVTAEKLMVCCVKREGPFFFKWTDASIRWSYKKERETTWKELRHVFAAWREIGFGG